MSENGSPDITTLTVQLLSAFVSNNSVPAESLAELIRTTRTALTEDPAADAAAAPAVTYTPAVSMRKSLSSPEHILSMIDGRPYKTLKRHLATHGLTPDEYRQRYDLPKSYPLVAPNYSEARRAVATRLGLGKKPVSQAKPAAPKADAAPKPTQEKPVAAKADAAPKPAQEKPVAAKAETTKPAVDKAPAGNGAKAPAKAKAKPKLSIRTAKDDPAAAPAAKPKSRSKPKASAAPAEPAS